MKNELKLMKNRLKKHLERLILLPYYPIWLHQNRIIKELRAAKQEGERWVAIADFNYGLAEDINKNLRDSNEAGDAIIKNQNDLIKLYRSVVAEQEERAENYKNIIDNYEKIISLIERRQ